MATEYTTREKYRLTVFLTDGKRLMTKKGSLDFLFLIYYIRIAEDALPEDEEFMKDCKKNPS